MQPIAAPRSVEEGTDVRVHLVQGQDIELASLTMRNVREIEGVLTGWSSANEALILSTRVTTGGGVAQDTQSETLRVPESNIEVLEVQATDGTKTAVFAVIAGALVAVALVAIASRGTAGGTGSEGPGGDPTYTAPIFPARR